MVIQVELQPIAALADIVYKYFPESACGDPNRLHSDAANALPGAALATAPLNPIPMPIAHHVQAARAAIRHHPRAVYHSVVTIDKTLGEESDTDASCDDLAPRLRTPTEQTFGGGAPAFDLRAGGKTKSLPA